MAKKLTDKKEEAKEQKVAKPASLLMDETVKEEKNQKALKTEKPVVTEVKASLRYLKMSARKVTPVSDAVRGLNAEEALRRLSLIQKGPALPVSKLIESALANAVHNFKLNREDLIVKNMVVGQAPSLKRFQPAAFGTAHPILKRSCHLEVTLTLAKPADNKKQVSAKGRSASGGKGQAKTKPVKPSTKSKHR